MQIRKWEPGLIVRESWKEGTYACKHAQAHIISPFVSLSPSFSNVCLYIWEITKSPKSVLIQGIFKQSGLMSNVFQTLINQNYRLCFSKRLEKHILQWWHHTCSQTNNKSFFVFDAFWHVRIKCLQIATGVHQVGCDSTLVRQLAGSLGSVLLVNHRLDGLKHSLGCFNWWTPLPLPTHHNLQGLYSVLYI